MSKSTVVTVLLAGLLLVGCSGHRGGADAASQMAFGVQMAERGLWSEAYFRFEQAEQLGGRGPEVLNNLAVASEALGRFDEALDHYRAALALAPGNRDLKANYDRFASFYESFRARDAALAEPKAEPALDPEGTDEGVDVVPPGEELPPPGPGIPVTGPGDDDVFGPEDVPEDQGDAEPPPGGGR